MDLMSPIGPKLPIWNVRSWVERQQSGQHLLIVNLSGF